MTREEYIRWLKLLDEELPFDALVDGKDEMDMHEMIWALCEKLEQEPKFIVKSDGTIEQIKDCNDCVFRKEWEKIGKLISVVLEKQMQEPKTDVLDKIKAVAIKWQTDTWTDNLSHEYMCEIADILAESEDKE